jgi:hypothetical protein
LSGEKYHKVFNFCVEIIIDKMKSASRSSSASVRAHMNQAKCSSFDKNEEPPSNLSASFSRLLFKQSFIREADRRFRPTEPRHRHQSSPVADLLQNHNSV